MQFIRTLIWVLLTAVLVAFIAINWNPAPLNFWPLANGQYLHFDWPVGLTILLAFLAGIAPMWLLHRAGRWRLNRRIATLENSLKAVSTPPAIAEPPVAPTITTDPFP